MASITLKTNIEGTKAISLIYEKTCNEDCPLAEECDFWAEDKPCKPHAQYCKSVYVAALDVCGTTFNTKEGIRLGLLLIPMFSILFQLQLEYSTLRRLTFMTEKGDIKINPLVAEIRKQISAIEKLWNNLGFKEPLPLINPKKGDGSYVDEIME